LELKDLSQTEIEQLIRSVTERVTEQLRRESGVMDAPSAQNAIFRDSSSCSLSTDSVCNGCGLCVQYNQEVVKEIIDAGADRIASRAPASSSGDIAPFIDHTLLKSNATDKEIETLCKEAMQYGFAAVCINSAYVSLASRLLSGSGVKVCTVVGFPLGAMSSESKAFETRDAIAGGADEIDMVINVGKLKSRDYEYVLKDIESVVKAAQSRCVKVILETASLADDEKVAGCILAKAAGAGYVKTSTGFGKGGATVEDVALMRRTVGEQMGVKAAGGIRSSEEAKKMLAAGASRIGASASVAIVKG